MNNFDKNIFMLSEYDSTIKNIDKDNCKTHCINNNYEGFTYKGDKNKCLLFNSHNFKNKLNDNINNYNIKTFLKTKNTINLKNDYDQLNYNNYFTEINNYGYMLDNHITQIDVNNKDECINSCINNTNKCNSIIYLEQPKECNFYKNKNMKINKNINNYDTYTTKNNINYTKNTTIINEIPLYPIYNNNLNYSDCEQIKIHDDINKQTNIFNKICSNKYGDEYIFDDNKYDTSTIIKCNDQNDKKIKCKINLNNGYIEHFNNKTFYSNIYIYILLFIIFLYYILNKKN